MLIDLVRRIIRNCGENIRKLYFNEHFINVHVGLSVRSVVCLPIIYLTPLCVGAAIDLASLCGCAGSSESPTRGYKISRAGSN